MKLNSNYDFSTFVARENFLSKYDFSTLQIFFEFFVFFENLDFLDFFLDVWILWQAYLLDYASVLAISWLNFLQLLRRMCLIQD